MAVEEAIIIRNVRKQYDKENIVLKGLNMTASKGSIYGLLGASGCGKTTLLSCIVGIRKIDSGDIWVLGGQPGSKESGIPGPRVGYMPQEISLVGEFTVIGAFNYFGRINGMNKKTIEERCTYLSDLLQLPPKNHMVKNMSGGQQRRVSFAAALLHEPELLILDEPTVGLDPILRETIWKHLAEIVTTKGTSVVITTHYIEETKLANKIGLMRCGELLAESSPEQLLAQFHSESLEDVFLNLSQHQHDNQMRSIEAQGYSNEITEVETSQNPQRSASENCAKTIKKKRSWYGSPKMNMKEVRSFQRRNVIALLKKNALQFVRHPGIVIFALGLPLMQTLIYFYAIGGNLSGLRIGVINKEAGDCNDGKYEGRVIYEPENNTCNYVDLSCHFLYNFKEFFEEYKFYNDINGAVNDIIHGKVIGAIHFQQNFSLALEDRTDNYQYTTEENIEAGKINVHLDMGNMQTGLYVKEKLYNKFFDIFEDIMEKCEIPRRYADVPLRFEDPLYGGEDFAFRKFVTPTFIILVVFFVATSVSSSIILTDRHEGIWNRSLVQGVTTAEIFVAHLSTQLIVVLAQSLVVSASCFILFNVDHRGPIFGTLSIIYFTGFAGLCYGFLISIVCTSHTLANYMVLGSFYPMLILSGTIWPLDGMPKVLMWLSHLLPTTMPALALRNLLYKHDSMNDPKVHNGFIFVFAWIIILLVFCIYRVKSKTA